LFDKLSKKPNLRQNRPEKANKQQTASHQILVPGNSAKSLFNFYQKNEHKVASNNSAKKNVATINNSNNSLFGNLHPISHPKPMPHEKSIHDKPAHKEAHHHERLENKSEINDEIHLFIEKSRKISSKIKNNEKTLNNLNSRIEDLVEKNNKIKKEIKIYKSLHKNKKNIESKVTNFLEKYEGEVKNIKSTILEKSHFVEKALKDKTNNFEKIYKDVVSNYSNLQTQVDVVKEKLEEIKKLENEKFNQMRKRLVLDDITVKNKLDVNGVAFINKINTDSVNLGNIRIESNKLMFSNEGSKIMVGNDVITVKDFFNIVKTMKYLQSKCGDNLEKCKPIDNDYLKQQEKKEIDILASLKTLRQITNDYLLNKKDK
jgi:hypothetical protein